MAIDLEAIKERLAAASPGPWDVVQDGHEVGDLRWHVEGPEYFDDNGDDHNEVAYKIERRGNAELIAHAREDLEQLVAEVERRRRLAPLVYHDGYQAGVDGDEPEVPVGRGIVEYFDELERQEAQLQASPRVLHYEVPFSDLQKALGIDPGADAGSTFAPSPAPRRPTGGDRGPGDGS